MLQDIINSLPVTVEVEGTFLDKQIYLDTEQLQSYSKQIVNHSPDGYGWGYSGSGPGQLALAILMEYMPVKFAVDMYQEFKFRVVAMWPQHDFKDTLQLRDIIQQIADSRS